MSKLNWLDRTLLQSPCYALCLSEHDFNSELRRLKISKSDRPLFMKNDRADATCHFFEKNSGRDKCVIVCLRDTATGRELEQVYALLVHEAVHIWQDFKQSIGETFPGDETEAYAIQRIAQSLMYSYKEQTR